MPGKSQFVYRFPLNQDLFIEDDTPVDIYIDDFKAPGEVVSSDVESLNLAFGQNHGKVIRQAVLVKSDTKLLEKQIARLDAVKAMTTGFNHKGGQKLFGFVQPQMYSLSSGTIDCYRVLPNTKSGADGCHKQCFFPGSHVHLGTPGNWKNKNSGDNPQ